MFTRTSIAATKTGCVVAVALGMLLWATAHATFAADSDTLPSAYAYLREARGVAPVAAQHADNFKEIRRRFEASARVSLAAGFSAPIDSFPSDFLARLHHALGSDLGLTSDAARQDEGEVLLKNSDAFVRAKVRLPLSKAWRGFVYADMGAADSEFRWQGLAGIHGGHGVDLLGGWRHVTYHFSPGRGFDSLEFNGPFFGATLAW
jgi:hypothetical protein